MKCSSDDEAEQRSNSLGAGNGAPMKAHPPGSSGSGWVERACHARIAPVLAMMSAWMSKP
jgi:hypothetical protein